MLFEVYSSGEYVTQIIAKDEDDAIKQLQKAGFRNRTNSISLIEI
jgi:hypothetical protein